MSEKKPPQHVSSQNGPSRPQSAVERANRKSDYWVFAAIVGTILGAIGLFVLVGFFSALGAEVNGEVDIESGGSPLLAFVLNNLLLLLVAALLMGIILISIRMMRQQFLGNALQVEYSDYAWLREWASRVEKDLEMPRIELMITQDPVMNAYAFGFMKPYTIVLNSGVIRWMSQRELKAVVVHEMAHIKYKHTAMSAYAGILRAVPGFGTLFGWLLDFWSRRAELSADRLALAYLKDPKQVKQALICLHVGPDVATAFSDITQQWQEYTSENELNRFTQTFSSHPFLVRRLQHIDATARAWQFVNVEDSYGTAT